MRMVHLYIGWLLCEDVDRDMYEVKSGYLPDLIFAEEQTCQSDEAESINNETGDQSL